MATTLDVTLSAAIQNELADTTNGTVGLYEVLFDTLTTLGIVNTLANNGTLTQGSIVSIVLPDSVPSGKVYFVVASESVGSTIDVSSIITNQSSISLETGAAYNFGYDSVELNLTGTATDAGNLTSVNEFGLPLSIGVDYNNGSSASVGYLVSGESIVNAITTASTSTHVGTFTTGPLNGKFRTAQPPATPSDWASYVQSLEGTQASAIILSGQFNGAEDGADTFHNGGYFAYDLSWKENQGGTSGDGNGNFWLAPQAGSQIQGYIEITPADLENSIYQTNGNAEIYTSETASTAYATINTGANDQWGAVLRDLVLGFNAGYFGSIGKPINPQASGTVDLGNSINWDPTYAFGNSLVSHPALSQWFNQYAEVFANESNSYGFGYSDALTAAYSTGGPLISLAQPGTATDVSTIDVTLYGQNETPSGYTAPTINNIITVSSGTFAVPTATFANDIVLTFNSARTNVNAGVVPDKTSTITLKILTADANGVPTWSTVTFDGSSVAAGTNGLWQQWTINGSPANGYTATPDLNGGNAQALSPGALQINNLPVDTSGGVSWYQVNESGAADPSGKTFNLYLTTETGGLFYNPGYTGQTADAAVDGLGAVQGPLNGTATSQFVNTLTYDLAGSSGNAADPLLNVQNTDPNYISIMSAPDAPVAGTNGGGNGFIALDNQDSQITNTITTGAQGLEFAWTGENSNPNTSSWITGYTNKLNGNDVALITIDPTAGGADITVTGTADIDGNWLTGPVYLDPAIYDITMQEYLAGDTSFSHPVGTVSQVLQLTETSMACFGHGTRILTTAGGVPVENMQTGDEVVLHNGGTAPVNWIGHRTLSLRRHPRPETVQPILFQAGALAEGLPVRDLMLSPDHALYLDGHLMPAKTLINGHTIRQLNQSSVTYYHVELPEHAVLYAEGVAAESYLESGNRGHFENGGVPVELHPDFAQSLRETQSCAPLVESGPVVEGVRRRLLDIAGIEMTADSALNIRYENGAAIIESRSAIPGQLTADPRDQRRLGVKIAAIEIAGRQVPLDDPALVQGWHAAEPDGRWTDGHAVIPASLLQGAASVQLTLAATLQYGFGPLKPRQRTARRYKRLLKAVGAG